MSKVISKSRFVSGIQCSKKLYFDIYRKDLKPEISEQQELLFSTGNVIGELAQRAFPNGKDASPENYYDFSKQTKLQCKKYQNSFYQNFEKHYLFYQNTLLQNC